MRREALTRRTFLTQSAALGLGGLLWGARGRSQTPPSQRLQVGLIGLGVQGLALLAHHLDHPRTRVVALCDADAHHLRAAVERTKHQATGYRDYQELLARDDVDAVCLATPDHWHHLMTVAACEAGQDVWVETPLSYTIAEGRAMADAAHRYGRVVQVGSTLRAAAHVRHVIELVHAGRLGTLKHCRAWGPPATPGVRRPDTAPPPELDWDRWVGPAPLVSYNAERVHTNWRWFWDYGGGMLTSRGLPLLDIALWALGWPHPVAVEARGALSAGGVRETPETMEVSYELPGLELSWSQQPNPQWDPASHREGLWLQGSAASLFVDAAGYKVWPEAQAAKVDAPLGPAEARLPQVTSPWDEFVDCVVARRRPTSEVETSHRAAVVAHLGNIAFRLGRRLRWDGAAERFVNDPAADRWLARPGRAPYIV